jgi:hypothetical protein
MEYIVQVMELDRETEPHDSKVLYQQRMSQDFNLSKLILALNVQKRKRTKKESTKEK